MGSVTDGIALLIERNGLRLPWMPAKFGIVPWSRTSAKSFSGSGFGH
jgi:hypothetical protein